MTEIDIKAYTNNFSIQIPYSSHNCCGICLLIKEQRLTDCLIYLERLGYKGDAALFMLAYLQGGAR